MFFIQISTNRSAINLYLNPAPTDVVARLMDDGRLARMRPATAPALDSRAAFDGKPGWTERHVEFNVLQEIDEAFSEILGNDEVFRSTHELGNVKSNLLILYR
jgi:hypothetical protein